MRIKIHILIRALANRIVIVTLFIYIFIVHSYWIIYKLALILFRFEATKEIFEEVLSRSLPIRNLQGLRFSGSGWSHGWNAFFGELFFCHVLRFYYLHTPPFLGLGRVCGTDLQWNRLVDRVGVFDWFIVWVLRAGYLLQLRYLWTGDIQRFLRLCRWMWRSGRCRVQFRFNKGQGLNDLLLGCLVGISASCLRVPGAGEVFRSSWSS